MCVTKHDLGHSDARSESDSGSPYNALESPRTALPLQRPSGWVCECGSELTATNCQWRNHECICRPRPASNGGLAPGTWSKVAIWDSDWEQNLQKHYTVLVSLSALLTVLRECPIAGLRVWGWRGVSEDSVTPIRDGPSSISSSLIQLYL